MSDEEKRRLLAELVAASDQMRTELYALLTVRGEPRTATERYDVARARLMRSV